MNAFRLGNGKTGGAAAMQPFSTQAAAMKGQALEGLQVRSLGQLLTILNCREEITLMVHSMRTRGRNHEAKPFGNLAASLRSKAEETEWGHRKALKSDAVATLDEAGRKTGDKALARAAREIETVDVTQGKSFFLIKGIVSSVVSREAPKLDGMERHATEEADKRADSVARDESRLKREFLFSITGKSHMDVAPGDTLSNENTSVTVKTRSGKIVRGKDGKTYELEDEDGRMSVHLVKGIKRVHWGEPREFLDDVTHGLMDWEELTRHVEAHGFEQGTFERRAGRMKEAAEKLRELGRVWNEDASAKWNAPLSEGQSRRCESLKGAAAAIDEIARSRNARQHAAAVVDHLIPIAEVAGRHSETGKLEAWQGSRMNLGEILAEVSAILGRISNLRLELSAAMPPKELAVNGEGRYISVYQAKRVAREKERERKKAPARLARALRVAEAQLSAMDGGKDSLPNAIALEVKGSNGMTIVQALREQVAEAGKTLDNLNGGAEAGEPTWRKLDI